MLQPSPPPTHPHESALWQRAVAALLQPPLLEAWLATKDEHDCVGERANCLQCPLTQYLNSMLTARYHVSTFTRAILWGSLINYVPSWPQVTLPPWALLFVRYIDLARGDLPDQQDALTAGLVREALRRTMAHAEDEMGAVQVSSLIDWNLTRKQRQAGIDPR